jgi:LSD1 subclass zinc finger protein
MSIRLVCPGCRKQLELPDAAAGQSGRCPVCNTVFNLPARVQQETYSAAPPPPPRRTAVARPIPTDPVPREDTPATGLTRGQKLGFAVVAAGMLAVIGFFLVRSRPTDTPAVPEKAVADASAKSRLPNPAVEPVRPAPAPAPTPNPPAEKRPSESQPPIENLLPVEDVGRRIDSPKTESDPPARPPIVTEMPAPKTEPKRPKTERPPKRPDPIAESVPIEPPTRLGGAGVYERLLKSTVMVIRVDDMHAKASRGTGSLINREHKLVLTNYHVVGDAREVFVTFPQYDNGKLIVKMGHYREKFENKEFIRAKVVRVLKGQDLALVELEKLPAGATVLRLASRSARPGEVVHSIGNPGASDAAWLYTKGEVRQVSHKEWKAKGSDGNVLSFDAEVLETTSPTNPGDSGGPLVDDFVRLVGVTQGANTSARGVSLFLDISEVRKLLKEQGIDEEMGGGGGDVARPENASIEEMVTGLASANARQRARAAAQLADFGPDAKIALHELIRALADSDRDVRKQAGNALLQIGPPERGELRRSDLASLRACLRDEAASGELQRYVIKALMLLGDDAKPAIPELGRLVKSDDKETRVAALAALEKFGPNAIDILADVAAGLKSDDRIQKARVALVVVKIDPEMKTEECKTAVAALIALQKPQMSADLQNKELIDLVNEAIKALTNLGKPALPVIRRALMTEYKGGNFTSEVEFANAACRLAMIRIIEAMGPKIHSAALDRDLQWLEKNDSVLPVRDAAKQARAKIRPGK